MTVKDPFGFSEAINWDVVDDHLDEIAEILSEPDALDQQRLDALEFAEEHVCDGDCNPGNCEVAHHDHFWGEEETDWDEPPC